MDTEQTLTTAPRVCGCYASLVDRLRGIYTIPATDGEGMLNESDTFTRRFEGLPPINEEAAKAIEHLSEMLSEVYSQCGNHRPPEKRHALTPNIRDRIRDWLYT